MTKVIVVGMRDAVPKGSVVINTTSCSKDFGKELSPFFLGPVPLWGGYKAKNVENAWQYSKVYYSHLDDNGDIMLTNWLKWAKEGWGKQYADRYPMGKQSIPKFSYWDGKKLDYLEARTKIYIPLYARAVRKTEAFEELVKLYKSGHDEIYLRDFDGYDHRKLGMNLMEVVTCKHKKMGHAFVLAMMLQFGKTFYLK